MNICQLLRNRSSGGSVRKRRQRQPQIKRYGLDQLSEEKLVNSQRSFSAELPTTTRSTYAITFSADRRLAAASTGDHNIHIIEVNSGKIVKTLKGHTRTCWSVVFHPTNPHLLASGDLSAEVRVWDISDPHNGYEVWRHESGGLNPASTPKISISLSFHPTDNVLLIAVQNELRIWDWKHKKEPFAMIKTDSDREKVSFIRLCPLGTRLISAIQQTSEIAAEEQLLPNPASMPLPADWLTVAQNGEPPGQVQQSARESIEARLLASSRSAAGTLGTRHFPHPRNNEHPLRFSLRNPYRIDEPQQQQPTNEEILQADPNLGASNFLSRRYEGTHRPFHRRQFGDEPRSNYPNRHRIAAFAQQYYLHRLNRRNADTYRRMREEKKLCRLQVWDFSPEKLPEISLTEVGLLQRRVKLNNDSSCSISADFSKIFCIVQPNDNRNQLQLTLISLRPETLGDILWHKDCTSDYLSCSLSPLGDYVAVGMKVRSSQSAETRLIEFFKVGEASQTTEPASTLYAAHNLSCQFVINAIAFMPCPGQGLMYGTSIGDLKIVVPNGPPDSERPMSGLRNPTVHLERIRVGPSSLMSARSDRRTSLRLSAQLSQLRDGIRQRQETTRSSRAQMSRRLVAPPQSSTSATTSNVATSTTTTTATPGQQEERQSRRRQWNNMRRPTTLGSNEVYWSAGRTGRARVALSVNPLRRALAVPPAASTSSVPSSSSSSALSHVDLENITEFSENINEFNNQLSQWRNRLPHTESASTQFRVIHDTIAETVSMVETLRNQVAAVGAQFGVPPTPTPSTTSTTTTPTQSGSVASSSALQWLANIHSSILMQNEASAGAPPTDQPSSSTQAPPQPPPPSAE